MDCSGEATAVIVTPRKIQVALSSVIAGLDYVYNAVGMNEERLASIQYEELDLNQHWEMFDLGHTLTDKGVQKFVADYKSILKLTA